jgi:4-hydroxymandelate oxidase
MRADMTADMTEPTRPAVPAPLLQALPTQAVNVADYEALAHDRLDAAAWSYVQGGAADEITCRRNRQAWDDITLWPRVLMDVASPAALAKRQAPTLLGKPFPNPVMLGPVAYQRLVHADGELASACAASAQGAGYILSTLASTPLSLVAQAVRDDAGRGPLWFQLYWQGSRDSTLALAKQARDAGFEALMLTVDAPVSGARDSKRRTGFKMPVGIHAVNALPETFDTLPALWADVQWLCERIQQDLGLPFLLKGILHPLDARQAQSMGVDALVVSNHGGRTLDTVPAAIDVLPLIRQAVGPDMPLLVDGGVRRGTDVFKALALGAQGVLLGRPVMHALAVAGAAGVAHVLRLLLDEFDMTMRLCGCVDLSDISVAHLWHQQGEWLDCSPRQ